MGSLLDSPTGKAHNTTQDLQGRRAKEGSAEVLHTAARACRAAQTAQTAVTAAPRPVAHAQRRVNQVRVNAQETNKKTTEAHLRQHERQTRSEEEAVAGLERCVELADATRLPAGKCGSAGLAKPRSSASRSAARLLSAQTTVRQIARRTAQIADQRIVKAPAESLLLQAPHESLNAKSGCSWKKAKGGASDAESGRRGAKRGRVLA